MVTTQSTPDPHAIIAEIARSYLDVYAKYAFQLQPEPFHLDWLKKIQDVVEGKAAKNKLLIIAPPDHAKALALDTPIPTPAGWTTMGALRVGDQVFDDAGQSCSVIGVSPIWKDRPVYEVKTDDGESVIADADHLWLAQLDRKSAFHLHPTTAIARPRSKRAKIMRAKALDLPALSLPCDPYVLGVWLGDGHSADARVTAGDQDRAFIRAEIESHGYPTTHQFHRYNFQVTGLRRELVASDVLNQKHVPPIFMRASYTQRLSLLQGIVDTDGTVAPDGQVLISTVRENLAKDYLELIRTLGIKASLILGRAVCNGKDCGTHYRVTFYLAEAARLPRKRDRCRDGVRRPDIYVSAKSAGHADTVCIAVDSPSHLFLAGKAMVPTHNSTYTSMISPSWYLGRHPDHSLLFFTSSASNANRYGAVVKSTLQENPRHAHVWSQPGARPDFDRGWSNDGLYLRGRDPVAKDPAYLAIGWGGSVVGARAHGILLDDILTQDESQSDVTQVAAQSYYRMTVKPRLHPNGWMLAIMTRWHENDFPSFLIDDPEWEVINAPAIGYYGPDTALWPTRHSLAWLRAERKQMGVFNFDTVYQGNPTARGGTIFQSSAHFKALPPHFAERDDSGSSMKERLRTIQFWDLAWSTLTSADYTAAVTAQVETDGVAYISDVWRGRAEDIPDDDPRRAQGAYGLDDLMADSIILHNPSAIGVEEGAFKQQATRDLIRRVQRKLAHRREASAAGVTILSVPVNADKVSRALLFAGRAAAGMVYVDREAAWFPSFDKELRSFPHGQNDDMVDAGSGLMSLIIGKLGYAPEATSEYGHGEVEGGSSEFTRDGEIAPGSWLDEGFHGGPVKVLRHR